MGSPKYDHIHQYRAIGEGRKIYRCIVPECTHSIQAALLVNRKAQCPDCANTFTVTENNLKAMVLSCEDCNNPVKKHTERKVNVKDLLAKVQS
jgi:hypothetical protein